MYVRDVYAIVEVKTERAKEIFGNASHVKCNLILATEENDQVILYSHYKFYTTSRIEQEIFVVADFVGMPPQRMQFFIDEAEEEIIKMHKGVNACGWIKQFDHNILSHWINGDNSN